ncbi:SDR family NAD(P)-dependent oxidoreductase [Arthrobacter sp. I2-34]|uniref:SDR family NAD(P)-dependent oxidoreductase n=1 Tax=Arthrobacter hankyongi TaxID=2904801 RepID=A0ABS9L3M0_9MICC|nr:SDR family NAD(P)-dependent oxidoreductase [Arthrobacter hankyongi]MCG2621236.1 SDR family NAD(P)-dependent oxidoreductase [Arthrobacter hankyongi]
MIRLDGKVIVVTGAGRGIGRAHAELLAARGAAVVIGDLGVDIDGSGVSSDPAQEVAEAITAAGGCAVACAADIREADGAQALLQAALDLGGRVDGLVNNAGILSHVAFAEMSLAEIQRQFDVHVFGTVRVTQTLWPELVRSGGSVVNTTSSGIFGAPVSMAYSIAKGAVFAFSRALATVGDAEGVRVNLLMPGAETRMQAFAREQFGGAAEPSEEARRRSSPALVAPVVTYLMSDECSLNGEMIYAGHGHVRRFVLASGDGIHIEDLTPELIAENWEQISRLEPLHIVNDLPSFRASLGAPMTESGRVATR